MLKCPNIVIDKVTLIYLITNDEYNEYISNRFYNPLDFNFNTYGDLIKSSNNPKVIIEQGYWYLYKQKNILPKITIQRDKIFYQPHNIFPLCHEVSFKLKFNNNIDVYNSLNKKLIFLFDIKNKDDMIQKITYHL